MSKTKQEKLDALRKHNQSLSNGNPGGTIQDRTTVRDAYGENLEDFAKEVIQTRQGRMQDRYGRNLPAYDIPLAEALSLYFGIHVPESIKRSLSKKQAELFVIGQFLKQNEVYLSTDTLASTAQRFGHDNMTASAIQKLLLEHSAFDGVNNTRQVNTDHRFIIPELILTAIRLDYESQSMHQNWISNTINISQRKVTMPHIKRGSAMPRKLGEAESIPFGTVRFGQKDAEVFKVGIGFKITDELVEASTLDMLFEFMGEVGTEMAIGADIQASLILLNGEQTSGAESAPVIGVDTVGQFKFKDIKRATARMGRLKRNVTRLLTGEDDAIDLSLLDEYKGFAGDKTLQNLQQMLGVPATLINDVFVMPSNQIMLLAPEAAMVKLQYRGMKTEERRNPQTQENELFVSDYLGFAIKRRDGRLLIDKSLAWGAPDNAKFPNYMDIDARINEAFKTINE